MNAMLGRASVVVGCFLLPMAVFAVQIENACEVTVAPAYVSQYMYRGTLLGHAAAQPSATVSWGPNSLELWSSFPISGKSADGELEVDLIGTRTWQMSEKTSLETMVQIYTYPRADLNEGYFRFTIEPSIGVATEIAGIGVTPRVFYDFFSKGPTAELTVTRSFNLTKSVTLETTAALGAFRYRDSINRTETPVLNAGRYWAVGMNLNLPTGTHGNFVAGWSLTAGEHNYYEIDGERTANPAAVRRGVLSLSWTWAL